MVASSTVAMHLVMAAIHNFQGLDSQTSSPTCLLKLNVTNTSLCLYSHTFTHVDTLHVGLSSCYFVYFLVMSTVSSI